MIDYFALALVHALLALALLRLAGSDATDRDPAFDDAHNGTQENQADQRDA
ncbi:hypothetical protein [Pelagerythrobacter sp.]|uniref:hypothetical protein n=1 Tax=Pelagerythrobacter sp. TaxID=2800702 RepID=UPI0035B46424